MPEIEEGQITTFNVLPVIRDGKTWYELNIYYRQPEGDESRLALQMDEVQRQNLLGLLNAAIHYAPLK